MFGFFFGKACLLSSKSPDAGLVGLKIFFDDV
jgi:hypothetical protein